MEKYYVITGCDCGVNPVSIEVKTVEHGLCIINASCGAQFNIEGTRARYLEKLLREACNNPGEMHAYNAATEGTSLGHAIIQYITCVHIHDEDTWYNFVTITRVA